MSCVAGHGLGSLGAGVVIDLLFHHGAVQIVGAEAQRHLRHARRHHDPVSLDVREVVEQQARHGDVLQIHKAARLIVRHHLAEFGVGGMKGQRNERLEAVRLILKLAQLQQVVHAILGRLDVPVKHGGVGVHAQFVRQAMHLQPRVGADLVVADDAAHRRRENLRAPAGQRVEPRVLQAFQHFAIAKGG